MKAEEAGKSTAVENIRKQRRPVHRPGGPMKPKTAYDRKREKRGWRRGGNEE